MVGGQGSGSVPCFLVLLTSVIVEGIGSAVIAAAAAAADLFSVESRASSILGVVKSFGKEGLGRLFLAEAAVGLLGDNSNSVSVLGQ